MAAPRDDSSFDHLFQLPLDQFTAARNALAKQPGAHGAAIRALAKPPLAAWAVNQLHWRDRDAYDALIDASEALRRTHKAVLGGKSGDLRAAGRAHDQALDRALKAAMAILTGEGHPASDAARQAIVSTLRALPGDEAPGRLTRTLQPGGFEMLAGFPLARGPRAAAALKPAPARETKTPAAGKSKTEQARDAKALAKAKEAAAAAHQALQRAERAAKAAEANRERAGRRATEADEKRTAARAKAQAAAEYLKNREP